MKMLRYMIQLPDELAAAIGDYQGQVWSRTGERPSFASAVRRLVRLGLSSQQIESERLEFLSLKEE